MKRTIGVCYYPEHWSVDRWETDARMMAETGITWVRIGEFAWSRIEPVEGEFHWDWLDHAIETLGRAGLKVVLGTPTATPPRWMIDRHPDMLAVDDQGRPRKFGSRRHYCFSHQGYRDECRRITRALAERYGKNPTVAAWQTDNEYDCHSTVLSYSDAARVGFRDWLAQRYQSPDALNRAWGNVFWSMEYQAFDQIDLPNLTVTEPNHPHVLAFKRYSSEQVVQFNRIQVVEIRKQSKAPIAHNYMGKITNFDHWKVGADLDIASWDSYPLGFLIDRVDTTDDRRRTFLRQGDPDFQAFHHDLYRGVGRGRWWVMEQQPGPVNWAPWNVAPLPGMTRLWAWEAFAHGAECVSYFRWRQAPFAQEQMHSGLLRPDNAPAPALEAAATVAREVRDLPDVDAGASSVAIVFDYESAWAWEAQPQGRDFSHFEAVFAAYRACRALGLNVDIIPPDTADLSAYGLVLVPAVFSLTEPLRAALAVFGGIALLGPRTDVKTDELSVRLPLGPEVSGLDVSVVASESLPPEDFVRLAGKGKFHRWFDHLEGSAPVHLMTESGEPAIMGTDHLRYLAGLPTDKTFARIIEGLCDAAGIETTRMPKGLRVRTTSTHRFVLNYAPKAQEWHGVQIPAAGVHWVAL